MPFLESSLEDMIVGWRKVLNQPQYRLRRLYVFKVGDQYQAFSNKNQGVGELIQTLERDTPLEELAPDPSHGQTQLAAEAQP